MKLLEAIGRQGYVASVATSFSCDLPFYESQVLHRLRTAGCTNNLLLVDATAYVEGLPSQAPLTYHAGKLYSVLPIDVKAAFHPKVFVQVGREQGRALLGSANVSLQGWARNREVVVELAFKGLDDPMRPLIARLYRYATSFCERSARATAFQLNELEREAPWVLGEQGEGPVVLRDGRTIALVLGPTHDSFGGQFARLIGSDTVKRLFALAPFWDEHGKAFAELAAAIGAESRVAVIQQETVSLARAAAGSMRAIAYPVTPDRYLHAKVYVAEGKDADHLLVGSANCSVRALGTRDVAPRNAEACLYERLPPGTALRVLGLDAVVASGVPVSPQDLPEDSLDEPGERPRPLLPGSCEREGCRIRWHPAPNLPAAPSRLELLDRRMGLLGQWPVVEERASMWCDPDENALMEAWAARGVLQDGSVTAPVVLHLVEHLRRSAPARDGTGVSAIVQRLRIGAADVLELLGPFQRLLFRQGTASKPAPGRSAPEHRKDGGDTGVQPSRLGYAEFIAGREAQPLPRRSIGAVERSDLAVLLEFLSDRFAIDEIDEEEDVLDDEEEAEARKADPKKPPPEPPPPPSQPVDLARARKLVAQVHESYCRWAADQRKNGTQLGPDEIAELGLLLRLASCLAARRLAGDGGALAPVIPDHSEESLSLLSLAIDVLGLFFVPGASGPTPASRVVVPAEYRIATEYPVTWCLCCWAACHAMAMAEREGLSDAMRALEVVGFAVYDVTGVGRGLFDDDEVRRDLLRAEADAGSVVSRDDILRWHDRFRVLSRESAPAGWAPAKNVAPTVAPGDRVWVNRVGPRYVRTVRSRVVELECPGVDRHDGAPHRMAAGFVTKAARQETWFP